MKIISRACGAIVGFFRYTGRASLGTNRADTVDIHIASTAFHQANAFFEDQNTRTCGANGAGFAGCTVIGTFVAGFEAVNAEVVDCYVVAGFLDGFTSSFTSVLLPHKV